VNGHSIALNAQSVEYQERVIHYPCGGLEPEIVEILFGNPDSKYAQSNEENLRSCA
jgi:hypothetical protein